MKMTKKDKQTNDFTANVLDRIKNEKIEMTPKWKFSLQEYSFWFLVLFFIMVGAVFMSIILLHLLQIDIAIAVRASGGIIPHIILFAPYLWIALLALMTILTWYHFKKTKRGYRYSYATIHIGSIIGSIIIGTFLYFGGAAQHAEQYAIKMGGEYYKGAEHKREAIWNNPEKGLLSGIPIGTQVSGSDSFDLVDSKGITWLIHSKNITKEEQAIIAVASKVAIIGTMLSPNEFTACRIIPWAQQHERGAMKKRIEGFLPKGVHVNERNIFDLRNSICERK